MAAPAFTPERAAWIRGNAWNAQMRKAAREGFFTACDCRYLDLPCKRRHHGQCRPVPGIVQPPALIGEPCARCRGTARSLLCRHATRMRVWTAVTCLWACGCPCHAAPVQLDLFVEVPA